MDPDRWLDQLNEATRRLADLADDSDEAARLRGQVDEALERLELCARLMDAGVDPGGISKVTERGLLSAEGEELDEYVDDLAGRRG